MGRPPPDLQQLGDEEHPIHISSLDLLLSCPWAFTGRIWEMTDDTVGAAAHTGTAVGRVIELWHLGDELKKALTKAKIESNTSDRPFDLAEWDEVEELATAYVAAGSRDDAEKVEHVVKGEIAPGVFVTGRLDQTRRAGGVEEVWDLKAGKPSGSHMLVSYACQLAGYAVAGGFSIGGIIRLRDYPKGRTCLYRAGFGLPEAELLMSMCADEVERIREGDINARPSEKCMWCRWGGIGECLAVLRKARD